MIDTNEAMRNIGILEGYLEMAVKQEDPGAQEALESLQVVEQALRGLSKQLSDLQLKAATIKLYADAL
jgi:hypothetical protein